MLCGISECYVGSVSVMWTVSGVEGGGGGGVVVLDGQVSWETCRGHN